MLKTKEIRELIKQLDKSSINKFVYEQDEYKICIEKTGFKINKNELIDYTEANGEDKNIALEDEVIGAKEKVKKSSVVSDEQDYVITSPMVGTFYTKPSPESDIYTKVGAQVQENSIVCIIEAMKLFNEIEAEIEGEILEVLVEDGALVEYDQPLFKVKTK